MKTSLTKCTFLPLVITTLISFSIAWSPNPPNSQSSSLELSSHPPMSPHLCRNRSRTSSLERRIGFNYSKISTISRHMIQNRGGATGNGKESKALATTSMNSSISSSSSPSSKNESSKKSKESEIATKIAVLTILTATTLNLLGFTLTSPLSPSLGSHFNLPLGASFGSLTSAYPLGMLFGMFLWPRLSDMTSVGRKVVMVTSLCGSGIGLGLQSWSILRNWSLESFLSTRVLTGCFAGSSPVMKAYLADLGGVDSAKLSRYLTWRDAASTLAYILGPAIGGTLFEGKKASLLVTSGSVAATTASTSTVSRALAHVIGISSVASFVAAALIASFVNDPRKNASRTKSNTNRNVKNGEIVTEIDNGSNDDDFTEPTEYEIIACPLGLRLWTGIATVCIVSFLYHVADSTFFAFFPALLKHNLSLDARQIGIAFTAFASISFCVSASSLSSLFIKKIGVVSTCAAGLGCIGAGLATLASAAGSNLSSSVGETLSAVGHASGGSATTLPFLAPMIFGAAVLYFIGVPLYGPTIPTMLLQCVPPNQRGTVMGFDGAINTVARVASPLVMGEIYRRKGAGMAFGIASGAAIGSAIFAIIKRCFVMRSLKNDDVIVDGSKKGD